MRLRAQRRSPHKHRKPLILEQLEHRTLLSGNLLVSAEVPGTTNYNLLQYTQQGALVSSQPIPPTPGATENPDARGLSVDPSGNANVFDGTLSPSVATLSAATQTWSFQTTPGWSTSPNITYGDVVSYKNFVFASNMQQANGIVRFDSSGGPPVSFAPGASFIQIALGQDGLLYGLEGTGGGPAMSQTVQVFNPDTLATVRSFTLNSSAPTDIRSIAVDTSGNVFAASWGGTVAKYDANGNPTGARIQLDVPPFNFPEHLISIALDTNGQIAVGGRGGEIYLTDESLTSVQTIQTGQANVFVTFDHYIGTAPQTVTPTFSSLAGPTITYGQSTVTLGGKISAPSAYPPGSVNITVAGQTESAAINPADGSFSAVFNTSTLAVSGSPYTITYSYPGQNNFAAVSDSSQTLTVNQAVTTIHGVSSPTVVIGAAKVTLSGTLGSNSILPVGQCVTVTLIGASGSVASGSGVIGSNGSFTATLNTTALAAGSYTIQYSYAGDANFQASNSSGTLHVTYAIKILSHLSWPVQSGAVLPIRLQVVDASGHNLSSANLTVTAISLIGPNGRTYTPHAEDRATASNVFRYVHGGYVYDLDTPGLPAGRYTLLVKVGNDPVLHPVCFVVHAPRHHSHRDCSEHVLALWTGIS